MTKIISALDKKAIMPPRDKYWGFVTGHALSLRKSRLDYMYHCFLKYGDFLEMYLGKRRTLLINDPKGLKHILFDNAKNYPKSTPGYQRVAEVLGMGVFTDVGEEWRRGRKVIQPVFNPSRFDHYYALISIEADKMVNAIIKDLDKSSEQDLSYWSMKYALNVIGRSLLNESLEESFQIIGQKLSELIELIERKMTRILPFQTPSTKRESREFAKALAILDGEIQKIIEREKEKPKIADGNLIHMLLDSNEKFSDQKILSHVKTMIFAGHETSANVIAWGFYFLMKYPKWQDRIFSEFASANFRIENEEEVKKMKSVNLFVNEVLRMRPPVWSFGRLATCDDLIHGERVRAGDLISISPYLMHHHPAYWENPTVFNPERFLKTPENLTFIPYGAGQRVCMGERLANLEIATIFLKMVRNFKIEPLDADYDVPMNPQVSLRPDRAIKAKLIMRDKI